MQKESDVVHDYGTNCVDCERYKRLGDVCVIEHEKKFLWEYCRDFIPKVELPDYKELMQTVKDEQALTKQKAREKKEREKKKRMKERLAKKEEKRKKRRARLRRIREKKKRLELKQQERLAKKKQPPTRTRQSASDKGPESSKSKEERVARAKEALEVSAEYESDSR
jgi:ATPase subunit of ABC transporter with duplicated ATPase domains